MDSVDPGWILKPHGNPGMTFVKVAGGWVLKQFESLGLKAELIETAGHPLVYAESPAMAGAPTVLVYGHYDVQPPDPLG